MLTTDSARRLPTGETAILTLLAVVGLSLIAYRYAFGLGAVTNLSDAYPWGFWIGIDILVGIALASGGFVMAGVVYAFGGRRFYPLARPAILTALVGYLLFMGALMVDLGRPWHIWQALVSWNHASPMFEVSWCVMLYTSVLLLEFVPAVCERLELRRLLSLWRNLVPVAVVALLTLFCFAMTLSLQWAAVTFLMLTGWEVFMRQGILPRNKQMPLLLIVAGITLSTLHQSSLGTLYLIVDKLHPLWYTSALPHLFLLSAVMVAPAMIILEAAYSERILGHRPNRDLLMRLARAMPYFIFGYLIVRAGDVILRGAVLEAMDTTAQAGWWWLEIALLLAAVVGFATVPRRPGAAGLILPAAATVLALVVHRTGVSMVGIEVPGYARYVPAVSEILITVGIISIGLLSFRAAVRYLPVYTSGGTRDIAPHPFRVQHAGDQILVVRQGSIVS